jgi:hypothetical protein
MSTVALHSAAPFCIEDNILNLFEGRKTYTFYVSQIEKMFLSRRKVLPASGFIGQLLHQYITASYKLHIITTTGEQTIIPIRTFERQAYIELISQFRRKRL